MYDTIELGVNMTIDIRKYDPLVTAAVKHFWDTRDSQQTKQKESGVADYGTRGAVTGGKQLDGFVHLLATVARDYGVPEHTISTRNNVLPGFFRPTKDWDFLIISKGKLISAIEFKSQVGSFGNNFNNRSEEVLGVAVDFWTAHKYELFKQSFQPWAGYFLLLEKSEKSCRAVGLSEPFFKAMPEYKNTSYMERYNILCQKLMRERHYSHAAVMWSSNDSRFGNINEETSLDSFLASFIGHLIGKREYF